MSDAVAAVEGVDSKTLRAPLFDTVDPDALDNLFRGSSGRVTFAYLEYVVSIDSDRDVHIRPKRDRDE